MKGRQLSVDKETGTTVSLDMVPASDRRRDSIRGEEGSEGFQLSNIGTQEEDPPESTSAPILVVEENGRVVRKIVV
jgi:hypothetical protein